MREIKFRVWNNRYKCFEYWGHIEKGVFKGVPSGIDNIGIDETCNKSEQYTGLNDKNGKEIYEGDIIKYEAMEEYGIGNIEYYLHVFHVMWSKKQNFHTPTMFTSIKYLGCKKEVEIIGNIHQNKDLLK